MELKHNHESIGIYRITSPNNSVYVGMTCDSFRSRVRNHIKDLRRGVHKCKGLQRAHDKYGIDNLSFEILEVMDNYGAYDVAQREIHWWVTHKVWGVNVYNGRPSGKGGVFHTDDTRRRISESLKKSYGNRSSKTTFVSQKKEKVKHETIVCNLANCHNMFFITSRGKKFCSHSCASKNKALQSGAVYDERFIIEKRLEGLSLRKISVEAMCSHITVRNVLLKHGVG